MSLRKTGLITVLILLLCLLLSYPVYADMGPKPNLGITVTHPPQESYYLDLLVPATGDDSQINEGLETFDQNKLHVLMSLSSDGWVPWITSVAPRLSVPDGLVGRLLDDGSRYHQFGYMVPDRFKIAIVTSDGQMYLSREIETQYFDNEITYDFASGEVVFQWGTSERIDRFQQDWGRLVESSQEGTETNSSQNDSAASSGSTPQPVEYETQQRDRFISIIIQFLKSLGATLLIEGFILVLFGYSLAKNWKVFLFTNIYTQMMMTIMISFVMYNFGVSSALLSLIPVEAFVVMIEVLIYSNGLVGKTKQENILYGIVANVTSSGLGFLLMLF